MKKKQYAIDMCSGPIAPKMIRFALPVLAASALQLMFNTADVIVVGKFVGDAAQAAVTSNGSLINLIICLFLGLSAGSAVVAGQAIGSGNPERVARVVHTSVLLGAAGGVLMGAVGFFVAPLLLNLLQVPQSVMALSALYLRVYFLGMPADLVYNFGSGLLRANGDTKRPMYFLIVAGILNVLMNLFFVLVLQWDVAGVAAATSLSKYVSAWLVIHALRQESDMMHLDLRRLSIDPASLRQIVRVGLPAGVQSAMFSLSNTVVQSAVNSMGEFVMAGGGISSTVGSFIHTGVNATFQTGVTFASQNYGAGKVDRIKKGVWWNLLLGVSVTFAMGMSAYLFAPRIAGLFTDDPRVIEQSVIRFGIVNSSYFLLAAMDAFSSVLRGMGWSLAPMFITMAGTCGVRLVWVATVFRVVGTAQSLYWVYPLSWIVTGTVFVLCYFTVRKRLFAAAVEKAARSMEAETV